MDQKPKMIAVYHCNEEWVKRAILRYHRDVSKFDYSEKEFDIEVEIQTSYSTVERVPGEIEPIFFNGAIITVNKKDNGNFKRSEKTIDWLKPFKVIGSICGRQALTKSNIKEMSKGEM